MQEKENVLRIFRETKEAIEKDDYMKIKNLSNQTTNTASLTHDPDNIAAAIVIYSLSKILERENYRQLPEWDAFYKMYINSINEIINSLEKEDYETYRKDIKLIRNALDNVSGKLKEYVQDVFRKAEINKASRIYAHGISMEKTANLFGITLFELANYTGERGNSEIPGSTTVNVKQRIKFATDIFG